jgi:hypothetical protein
MVKIFVLLSRIFIPLVTHIIAGIYIVYLLFSVYLHYLREIFYMGYIVANS